MERQLCYSLLLLLVVCDLKIDVVKEDAVAVVIVEVEEVKDQNTALGGVV